MVLENFIIRSPEVILKIGTPAFYLDNDSMVFVHEKKTENGYRKSLDHRIKNGVFPMELRSPHCLNFK